MIRIGGSMSWAAEELRGIALGDKRLDAALLFSPDEWRAA
jgi:hypothetical protein